MKRSPPPARRTPLSRVGARASRDKADLQAFRTALLERAAGLCERCGCRVREILEAHHLVRRARCIGWPLRHDPEENGAAVCFYCHRSLDLDPEDVGGPLEGRSRRAHAAFEKWRSGNP